MNKFPYHHIYRFRKDSFLNLKDIAFLLDIDEGNLSRFEAGKSQNSKALIGYHILFGMSIDNLSPELIKNSGKEIINRAFLLLERLNNKSKTRKNILRIRGVNSLIKKLTPESEYEN